MISKQQMGVVGIAIATSAAAAVIAWLVSSLPTAHPDFAILWTAVRNPNPYDLHALKSALDWEPGHPVAFIYPPSALPILALFGLLPFRVALALWAGLSGLALALSSRSKLAPLLLLTPPALWALPGGQTSLLLGSILFGAVQLLNRPILAGIILGLAVSLKPQLAVVFPLALLLARKWDVLAVSLLTLAAMTLLSAALFGFGQWDVWMRTLPAFLSLHETSPILRRNEIAFGLPPALRATALIVGVWLTTRALKRDDHLQAFVCAVGSALIASSHAMGYEFAMFVPVFAALSVRRGPVSVAAAIFILTPAMIWIWPGLLEYAPRLAAIVFLIAALTLDDWRANWNLAPRFAREPSTPRP